MKALQDAPKLSDAIKLGGPILMPRQWCGTYKVLQPWFIGASTQTKAQMRWSRGSSRGSSTAELGITIHDELSVAHSKPREGLHPMTKAVIDALEKRGFVLVCGDTLVMSPKRDVATGVDLIVTRNPDQAPLQVILIEVKTGGVGAAGKRFGSGKKHACPPLHAIPQTLQGFAHAQLAATSFLFDFTRPTGAIATGAMVVSVSPGTRTNKTPRVHMSDCLAPFMNPGHAISSTDAWQNVLLVGRVLVEGRASAALIASTEDRARVFALNTEVEKLPWKPTAEQELVDAVFGPEPPARRTKGASK
jgi:hypothetical protein